MPRNTDDGGGRDATAARSYLERALARTDDALERWRVSTAFRTVDYEDAIY